MVFNIRNFYSLQADNMILDEYNIAYDPLAVQKDKLAIGEMNMIIARDVMGWKQSVKDDYQFTMPDGGTRWAYSGLWAAKFDPYSEIQHAWEVVKRLKEQRNFFGIKFDYKTYGDVGRPEYLGYIVNASEVHKDGYLSTGMITVWNKSASKAICLAVLKARGHDIERWKRVW